MHVNQIASRFVQLLFSMPLWQAAVHFRPALAHAHFVQAPSLHLHPPLLVVRRRFFLGGGFASSSPPRGEEGGGGGAPGTSEGDGGRFGAS